MTKWNTWLVLACTSALITTGCASSSALPQRQYSMSVINEISASTENLDFRLVDGYVLLFPGQEGEIRVDNVTIIHEDARCLLSAIAPVSATSSQAIRLFSLNEASRCIPGAENIRAIGVSEQLPRGKSLRADYAFKVNYSTLEIDRELQVAVPIYF